MTNMHSDTRIYDDVNQCSLILNSEGISFTCVSYMILQRGKGVRAWRGPALGWWWRRLQPGLLRLALESIQA